MQAVAKLPILLRELKLPSISKLWQTTAEQAIQEGWEYEKYLAILSEIEVNDKQQKRIAKYLKMSGLKSDKVLSSFDFDINKSINKQQVCALSNSTTWVSQGNNIIILGPSGVGKTHLAMGIGHNLISQGIKVLFKSSIALTQELQLAKKSLGLSKYIGKLNNYQVVILDDIGYVKKSEVESSVLFELISERYEYKSLIVTCNQAFGEWEGIFADAAMTIAAIDRLVHHATIINISGDSFRRIEYMKNNTKTEPVS